MQLSSASVELASRVVCSWAYVIGAETPFFYYLSFVLLFGLYAQTGFLPSLKKMAITSAHVIAFLLPKGKRRILFS